MVRGVKVREEKKIGGRSFEEEGGDGGGER